MARTYAQIRQLTAQQLGQPWPVTGTVDSYTATTITHDELGLYPDDFFNGAHVLLTSGTHAPSAEIQVTNHVQSTGVITFRPTLTGGGPPSTYEIMPFRGTDFLRAIQDSVHELYDTGTLVRPVWMRFMGGSPIYNADWSYWDGDATVHGWSLSGATMTRYRDSLDPYSMAHVRLSAADGTLTLDSTWRDFLFDFAGYTVTLACNCRGNKATMSRLNLVYDDNSGSTVNNYSSYHSGNNNWELLSVEVTIPKDAGQIRVILDHTNVASGFGFWGMPFFLHGPRVLEYPFPANTLPDGPNEVRQARGASYQLDELASGRGLITKKHVGAYRAYSDFTTSVHRYEDLATDLSIIDYTRAARAPVSGNLMWALGDGPLTVPATINGTENIEVTYQESLLLATMAALKLIARAPLSYREVISERTFQLRTQYEVLAEGVGATRSVTPLPLRW
jgi:hypothetical protein